MVVARRPPNTIALMGTPSGSSHAGSMVGHWEAGAVKRAFGWAALAPVSLAISGVHGFPRPVETLCRRRITHALPPDSPLWSERYVGKNRVFRQGRHRVWVRLDGSADGNAKEAKFRVDSPEPALSIGPNPGDVVTDGPDFPAFLLKMVRRNEHGEIRLATGARERRRNVGFLALRVLDPEDEHVLGHPALVTGHVGGNAKGEAFFAKQSVATVTGPVTPD